jgi:hypothetical protein
VLEHLSKVHEALGLIPAQQTTNKQQYNNNKKRKNFIFSLKIRKIIII